MMKYVVSAVMWVCLTASGVQAFETSSTGSAGATQVSPAKPLDLSTERTVPEGNANGGVKIPGLGALGVLPKLDFGLELLYGDTQGQAEKPSDDHAIESDSDGLRIRGTFKHRF